jgi:hypothetical protein
VDPVYTTHGTIHLTLNKESNVKTECSNKTTVNTRNNIISTVLLNRKEQFIENIDYQEPEI